jgi:16S rRNA C967 or C1407 C5-methylase (RsmB/RsmF family)/NOL1/NOP2/fmu family ribosome biogenesis protein
MQTWPEAFAQRMEARLGPRYPSFVEAWQGPAPHAIRLHPTKGTAALAQLAPYNPEPIGWCNQGYYLAPRPLHAQEPAWHAGGYYVQEASSMWLEVMRPLLPQRPLTVVDLCAAPGGKSTHLLSLLPEGSVLLANEIVPKRNAILRENLLRWGNPNLLVSQCDPATLTGLGQRFDVVLVDAPCSGEGLWRRDPNAISQWSTDAVAACALRQRDILVHATRMLKPEGLLVYSTCTFAPEENDAMCDWLVNDFGLKPIKPTWPANSPKPEAVGHGWACLPDNIHGEGFFFALFCSSTSEESDCPIVEHVGPSRLTSSSKEEAEACAALAEFIQPDVANWVWHRFGTIWRALPPAVEDLRQAGEGFVQFTTAGLALGEGKGSAWIPHTHLVASGLAQAETIEIDRYTAQKALKGETHLNLPEGRGWTVLTHEGLDLLWVKRVGGRANNHYPQALRIRQDLVSESD